MRTRLVPSLLASLMLGLLAGPAGASTVSSRDVCAPLQGDSARWDRNADRRESIVEQIATDGGEVEIVHSSAGLRQPVKAGVDGLDVTGVTRARDGRYVAQVSVAGPLATACGADDLQLRQDDALGTGWQVVSVLDSGVLLLGGDRLVWLARNGAIEPDFRMVWVSPFLLDTNVTTATRSPAKKTTRTPRRRARKG